MSEQAIRHWIIAETNWKHVREHPYQVAVLPMGATEAHNWHLPYGTDSYQNEYICAEAGRIAWESGARVGILPNIPFGVQTGQLDIPFCINMNPSTQLALLEDVVESLEGVGVPKLVIINGHGGNDFKQMLRELQARHPTVFLSVVSWYQIPFPKDMFTILGDHADERETSMMMHIHPHLVLPQQEWGDGSDNPNKLTAIREKWAWAQRAWTQATNDTGSGDPAHSTADKGQRYLAHITQKLADYFIELAAADPKDLYLR
jgi:creatinine amidohydrolase